MGERFTEHKGMRENGKSLFPFVRALLDHAQLAPSFWQDLHASANVSYRDEWFATFGSKLKNARRDGIDIPYTDEQVDRMSAKRAYDILEACVDSLK